MKTLRIYIFIALAAIACSCSKTDETNDPYGIQSKHYNYFEVPQKIISRSGAEFEVFGWLIEDGTKDNQKFNILRLLCKWPQGAQREKNEYTKFTVLVDSHRLSPKGSYPLWAENGASDADRLKGIEVFIITESFMPEKWDEVEIHFEGLTPSTLKIENI